MKFEILNVTEIISMYLHCKTVYQKGKKVNMQMGIVNKSNVIKSMQCVI